MHISLLLLYTTMVNKDEYIKTDEEQLNSRNALLMVKQAQWMLLRMAGQ